MVRWDTGSGGCALTWDSGLENRRWIGFVLADFERDLMGEHIQWGVARALKAQGLARYGCPQHSRSGKNLHGAIADFTKAIEAKPDHAEAYRSRGLARRANKNSVWRARGHRPSQGTGIGRK